MKPNPGKGSVFRAEGMAAREDKLSRKEEERSSLRSELELEGTWGTAGTKELSRQGPVLAEGMEARDDKLSRKEGE